MAHATPKQTLSDPTQRSTHRNEVELVGRLSAPPIVRALPSGDVLLTWRLIVERPSRQPRRGAALDTIECVSARAALRRTSRGWQPGDVVEVAGALRRRFWRGPAGPASRYEVEVERARRISKAL